MQHGHLECRTTDPGPAGVSFPWGDGTEKQENVLEARRDFMVSGRGVLEAPGCARRTA